MAIALRLAKSGWWGGDVGRILNAPADEVVHAIEYDSFISDYERASFELNKEQT